MDLGVESVSAVGRTKNSTRTLAIGCAQDETQHYSGSVIAKGVDPGPNRAPGG
jgi:hypothetical protein